MVPRLFQDNKKRGCVIVVVVVVMLEFLPYVYGYLCVELLFFEMSEFHFSSYKFWVFF